MALGLARAAIDEPVALAQGKTPFASTTTLRERATAQGKLGRAEGLLNSARAYLYDRLAWAWQQTVDGVELTLEQRAEVLLACVQAIYCARLRCLGDLPADVEPVVWTSSEWRRRRDRRDPITVDAETAGVWLVGDPDAAGG